MSPHVPAQDRDVPVQLRIIRVVLQEDRSEQPGATQVALSQIRLELEEVRFEARGDQLTHLRDRRLVPSHAILHATWAVRGE